MNVKYLKLPLCVREEEGNCGLGGCDIAWSIRDAMNDYLAEVYDKNVAKEIARICNEQIK